MYQSFLTYIKEKALIQHSDSVLLTVSGGVDSMVMLHMCHLAGFDISVAHVNFGLRGEASDADEQLVKDWCDQNDVPFYLRKVRTEEYQKSESTQMNARTIRYDFFDKLVAEHGLDKIATAHNQNDSLETVLLNLTKGTGVAGLTGIAQRKGNLIRPLIFATKEKIYTYAKQEGLSWREDASNQKSDYQRNLIRNEVLPILLKINPSLITNFNLTQERIQGASEMVTFRVNEKRAQLKEGIEESIMDMDWYQDDAMSLTILSELIRVYGFNHTDAKDLGKSILDRCSGKVFDSKDFRIHLNRNKLTIHRVDIKLDLHPVQLVLGQAVTYGKSTFMAEKIEGNVLPQNSDNRIAYFDADKVRMPLTIRSYREGESFSPLGLLGTKKVSDFLIDNKVALHKKRLIPIMESEGEIVWISGLRLDDRFKIDTSTENMIRVEMNDI